MFKNILLSIALMTAFAAQAGVIIYAPIPPPPLMVEVITDSPGPDYAWCDGYWFWQNDAYIWIAGGWRVRPYPGAIWFRGQHVRYAPHGNYQYHPAHWGVASPRGRGKGKR